MCYFIDFVLFIFQLDAKNSPLALLVQTCSNLGKDVSKPIASPSFEKKDKESIDKASENTHMSNNGKDCTGNYDKFANCKPGFRKIVSGKVISPISRQSASKYSETNSSCMVNKSNNEKMKSPSVSSMISSHNLTNSTREQNSYGSPLSLTVSGILKSDSKGDLSPPCLSSTNANGMPVVSSSSSPKRKLSSPATLSLSSSISASSSSRSILTRSSTHPSFFHGLNAAHPLAPTYPHLPLLPGLDPALQSYHNALAAHSGLGHLSIAAVAAAAAQSSAALKASGCSSFSPFVSYARVRTPSGATTLVPVCQDRCCANCNMTLQNSHLSSTCTSPGCSQCAHEKWLTGLSSLAALGANPLHILPQISSNALSGLPSLHSPLYPLAAHQGMGYICSWMAGSEYCGKRCNSSEELLQHLRTHTCTLSSGMEASSLAAFSALGLHPGLAPAENHYAGSPLGTSSLGTFSSSLSPVSSLLNAHRYHPYKSSLSAVQQSPSSVNALASGYYPYSLYASSLGSPGVP